MPMKFRNMGIIGGEFSHVVSGIHDESESQIGKVFLFTSVLLFYYPH